MTIKHNYRDELFIEMETYEIKLDKNDLKILAEKLNDDSLKAKFSKLIETGGELSRQIW